MPLLVLGSGCGGLPYSPPAAPDYGRPFEIVLAQYSVPIAMGVASPDSVGGWDQGVSLKRWVQGWTHHPAAHDVDNDFVNYVLHPLAGSETHMIARNHGWSFLESVLFDVFGSVSWEYVFENVFEPPSRIDLMVTAPIGAIVGELRWHAKQAGLAAADPLGDGYEPFFEITPDGIEFGIQFRF